MNEYILGALGIAVSIGLFLIGYRQTVGAKKERMRSANSEIEKILLRRIVLESYTPNIEHITRLIDGKARDFRVRPSDLLSEGQMLNTIFTRLVETDFIPPEQREELLERMLPIIGKEEEQPILVENLDQVRSRSASIRLATITTAVIAGLASVVGALVAALPQILGGVEDSLKVKIEELLPSVVATAMVSLSMISFLVFIYRTRERQQEEPSKASALSEYVEFERDVIGAVRELGTKARVAGPQDRGYDLIIEPGGRKILVEVKAWKQAIPSRIIAEVLARLHQAMSREGAAEAILVTRTNVTVPERLCEDDRVRVMTLREFKNYLQRLARA